MRKICLLIVLFLTASGLAIPFLVSAEDTVSMYCLNIGKADCIILRAYGKDYLIDTGYEQNYPALENALKELDITKLDGVFLTHTDADHAGGLLKLSMSGIPVDVWYAPGIYYNCSEEKHPLRLAAAIRGKQVNWLTAGDVVRVSDSAELAVIGPVKVSASNENNNSLVLRFDSTDGSILLTGDMKSEEEASLISAKRLSAADVLKVGHHGDNGATSAAFVQIVKPKLAVISTSTGEESDTPDSRVLERLRTSGCRTCVITQDFDDAVQVVLESGHASVQNIRWASVPERIKSISMTLDTDDDKIILYNNSGNEIALEGCVLYAKQNQKSFKLKNITVQPYSFYIIGSAKTQMNADYVLQGTKRVWNKSKPDVAILYDKYGRVIAAANNGLTE